MRNWSSNLLFLFTLFLLSSFTNVYSFFTDGEKHRPEDEESMKTRRIEVNGDKLGLDELGPMIINPDGTARRIANWNEMTAHEQETAWRRIVKRNRRRVQKLKAAGLLEESDDNASNDSNEVLLLDSSH